MSSSLNTQLVVGMVPMAGHSKSGEHGTHNEIEDENDDPNAPSYLLAPG